jgi:hypothetical protein
MKALAGPAMLLVIVLGFLASRGCADEKAPSHEFVELELAGADPDHTGTCYSLSTVLIANGVFGGALRTWVAPRKGAWTLGVENVQQGYNGPVHQFQRLTFEKVGGQVRLVAVEASPGFPTDLKKNIDNLLESPNARRSTPVDRCLKNGGSGYLYSRK